MIEFRKEKELLILSYYSTQDIEWVDHKDTISLRKTFFFKKEDRYIEKDQDEFEFDTKREFILGHLTNEYYLIDKEKLGLNHNLYISTKLDMEASHFTTYNNISIFKRMDKLINREIYIGGKKKNNMPTEDFNNLISNFPNTYELKKYVDARLSTILRDYFDNVTDSVKGYEKYMNSKISRKGKSLRKILKNSELEKYTLIEKQLNDMLSNEDQYNEQQWQHEILDILLLIFPKYIKIFEEVKIKDIYSKKNRRLDYLLVDSGGNVDIVEIKKPFGHCIVTKNQYRDNYIPKRELSGTIMQIEKYIFYLNKWGKDGERALTRKYINEMPKNFQIHITNPSAIIIMGREKGLSKEQLQDFEIIKRKYKNVTDIITYDDLLKRLKYIIQQLETTPDEN